VERGADRDHDHEPDADAHDEVEIRTPLPVQLATTESAQPATRMPGAGL
jgi:hypothetical protein